MDNEENREHIVCNTEMRMMRWVQGVGIQGTEVRLGEKRGSECHTHGLVPHGKEAAVVWTHAKRG